MQKFKKKEEARKTYDRAIKEGKSASLLEQQRPNVFQMKVGNIMPGDTIIVELKYTELLVPVDRVYEFVYPAVVGPRYSNKIADSSAEGDKWVETSYTKEGQKPSYLFNVNVSLSTAVPLGDIECISHGVSINKNNESQAGISLNDSEKYGGNRDYILRYSLAGKKIETGLLMSENGNENFFLLMLQPPKRVEPQQIPPREFVFVLDVSGSMHGMPLDIAKELMKNLLGKLNPSEKFNLVLFSGSSTVLSDNPLYATGVNIQKAVELIEQQKGGGGTELLPALSKVFTLQKDEGHSRTIVIITDGYVDVEEETFDLIRNNLNRSNVFSFGIGSSVNRYIIEGMARAGMGEPFIVTNKDNAESIVEKFRKYIESPVMTDIKVEYDGFLAYDVEPLTIPDVLAERPILIYGKWMGKPSGHILVSGVSGNTRYKVDVSVLKFITMKQDNAIKYLWARNKIAGLSDYNVLLDKVKRNDEIANLGIKYNLLTQYTSFVAVDYVSRNKDSLVRVKLPLPLPEGVSDYAVGGNNYGRSSISSSRLMINNIDIGSKYTGGYSGKINPLMPGRNTAKDKNSQISEFTFKTKDPVIDTVSLKNNIVYPVLAKLFFIEGIVKITALINENGKVDNTLIEYSDNQLLDTAAIEAIKKSKFLPAESNGHPIPCRVTIPIEFKLDSESIPENYVKDDFKTTPSGLKFKDIVNGKGEGVKNGQKVTIHYKGYLPDGTRFDGSYESGKALTFIAGNGEVIKAFDEGLLAMKAGGKRILLVPPDLALGGKGLNANVPAGTRVYFEIELVNID